MDNHILSILVENHAGVLSRVSGLFSRRGFNIESLAVGTTEDPEISRITIVVKGDDYVVDQVKKQLSKLIDVLKIELLDEKESVSRELVLIKVKANSKTRTEIMQIVDIFRAKIIDVSQTTLTIEQTGNHAKLMAFIDMLSGFGICELARTGLISLERGNKTLHCDQQK